MVQIPQTSNQSNLLYLTDRSAIETDWLCGMRFWWNRLEAGGGIVPKVSHPALIEGTDLHDDLQMFPKGLSLEEILITIKAGSNVDQVDQVGMEILSRRMGWATQFSLYVWPWLMDHYTIVDYEKEFVLCRDPLFVLVKPDLILRSKKTGKLVYIEYKSTGDVGPGWCASWPHAIQLHLGLTAIEEYLKEKVEFGQVIGFNKGYNRDGRMVHPYVWAYRSPDGDEWQNEYRAGWNHATVWEYPGGMAEWVRYLGKGGLDERGSTTSNKNLAWSAPVYADKRMVDDLVIRRIIREDQIAQWRGLSQDDWDTRITMFEQRFNQCKPSRGPACPYLSCCFNAAIQSDPLINGEYKKRVPHHDIEIAGLE